MGDNEENQVVLYDPNQAKEIKSSISVLSKANQVADEEQLIFDAIAIPALIYLTVAISILRS
eukprot:759812-Hanusia_phi.AAC.1